MAYKKLNLSIQELLFSVANMIGIMLLFKIVLYYFIEDIDLYTPFIAVLFIAEGVFMGAFGVFTLMSWVLDYNRIVLKDIRFQFVYVALGAQSYLMFVNSNLIWAILLPIIVSLLTAGTYLLCKRQGIEFTFNIKEIAIPLWKILLKSLYLSPLFLIIVAIVMWTATEKELINAPEVPSVRLMLDYYVGKLINTALFIPTPLWIITYALVVFRVNTVVVSSLATQIVAIVLLIGSYIAASFLFTGTTKEIAIYGPPTLFLILQGITLRLLKPSAPVNENRESDQPSNH